MAARLVRPGRVLLRVEVDASVMNRLQIIQRETGVELSRIVELGVGLFWVQHTAAVVDARRRAAGLEAMKREEDARKNGGGNLPVDAVLAAIPRRKGAASAVGPSRVSDVRRGV